MLPRRRRGARRRLEQWSGSATRLDYAGVRRAVERWHPYAGLACFHLLLRGLEARGEEV